MSMFIRVIAIIVESIVATAAFIVGAGMAARDILRGKLGM